MKFGNKMYGAKEAYAAKTSAKTHDTKMRSAARNKSEDEPKEPKDPKGPKGPKGPTKRKTPATSGPKDFPPIDATDTSSSSTEK